MNARRLVTRINKRWLVAAIMLLLAVAIVVGLVNWQHVRQQAAHRKAGAIITYSTATPSEQPPTSNGYQWVGQVNDPKQLELPTIHATGYIQKVGVDQHTQVAVPNNIYLAGWFVNSARPGQPGLSIIDGHVDGVKNPGIFDQLSRLKAADQFSVELGDGSRLHYRVLQVVSLPVAQAATALFSQDPTVASQLNLITCGGTYNRQQHAYENRVVVSAALL